MTFLARTWRSSVSLRIMHYMSSCLLCSVDPADSSSMSHTLSAATQQRLVAALQKNPGRLSDTASSFVQAVTRYSNSSSAGRSSDAAASTSAAPGLPATGDGSNSGSDHIGSLAAVAALHQAAQVSTGNINAEGSHTGESPSDTTPVTQARHSHSGHATQMAANTGSQASRVPVAAATAPAAAAADSATVTSDSQLQCNCPLLLPELPPLQQPACLRCL